MLKAMALPTTVRASIRPNTIINPWVKTEASLEGPLVGCVGGVNKWICPKWTVWHCPECYIGGLHRRCTGPWGDLFARSHAFLEAQSQVNPGILYLVPDPP